MKFVLALLAVSICCFGLIEASPNPRMKRALAKGDCPKNEDCEAHVKNLIKNSCSGYTIFGGSFEIQSCGAVICDGVRSTNEDLSKPYPDCCPKCV